MTRIVLTAALAAVLLTSCGGANRDTAAAPPAPPSASSTTTPSATPSPEATQTPSKPTSPFAPNIGKRALRIGEARQGEDVVTTVLEVKRPMVSSNPYRVPDEAGQEFMGVRVSQCLRKQVTGSLEVDWRQFLAMDAQAGRYPGSSSSWSDWPVPQFPTYSKIRAGQCVAGWMLIPVPKGAKITKIVLESYGYPASAEWLLTKPKAAHA